MGSLIVLLLLIGPSLSFYRNDYAGFVVLDKDDVVFLSEEDKRCSNLNAQAISDASECRAASKKLKNVVPGLNFAGVETSDYWLKGCYVHSSGDVYFNNHPTGGDNEASQICLTSTKYEAKDSGVGCGIFSIPENECKTAAARIGYDSSAGYEVGNWGHLPSGCFVGHAHTNWKYTYFNNNKGRSNNGFKSICKNHHGGIPASLVHNNKLL